MIYENRTCNLCGFLHSSNTQLLIKESKCGTTPATPKSSNSLRMQQCNLLWLLFINSKAKTWNMYALAYCWDVTALASSGRFENVFFTHVILRLPYANAVAGGISPSKLSQICSHLKLVGSHIALPSIAIL